MYKLKDLMMMFSIPERTIRRHLKEGILSGTKIGGNWRFEDKDIENYLKTNNMTSIRKKNTYLEIMDYVNGFSEHNNETFIVKHVKSKAGRSIEISTFVSTFKNPFFFNYDKKNDKSIIVFKGHNEDVLQLLEKINEWND